MRLVFMGTPPFARIVLDHLLKENFEILALCTQPSKPFGRQKILKHAATKEFLQHVRPDIPIFEPAKLDDSMCQILHSLKPDAIVVVAYGKILPQSFLDLAPCLNLHGSLLPQFRGASPMQEMILNDLPTFGVSVIRMDAQMDAGDILGSACLPRDRYVNAQELGSMLAPLGAKLLADILRHPLKPTPQDHAQATYCTKITKQAGLVDFTTAKAIFLKSLAYYPWPGIFLASGLKLLDIELIETEKTHTPGCILDFDEEAILVGCAQGTLKITSLQAPGKARLSAKAYLSGKRLKPGAILN
ncbi:methionyl-tRNA formyltransferase [Helicobacter cynogastricus]|uniref:methionyl-tRNA formyltransferase n=1 Tax=Helicobacter cynogastricus TaxID=329937 RepID=UPI000CF0F8DD|nr:methionyl-tRNA formyltransferase [Helicobacter cynogastricus]